MDNMWTGCLWPNNEPEIEQWKKNKALEGIEPSTSRLLGERSNHWAIAPCFLSIFFSLKGVFWNVQSTHQKFPSYLRDGEKIFNEGA